MALSFFGDAENLKLKIASYEHTENNTSTNKDLAEERVEHGIDPFGRPIKLTPVPMDSSYPSYILNNQEKYSEFIRPWN